MTEPPLPQRCATPSDPNLNPLLLDPAAANRDCVVRRRFLGRISILLSSVIAAIVAVPAVGFVLAPILRRAPQFWRDVGSVEQFDIGQTVKVDFEDPSPVPWAGVTARSAAWLRRHSAAEFIAFSINCRHLGCPVRWLADAELFMCPCHGGVYYQDGTVAAGPPPAALMRYPVRIVQGRVQIETSPIPLPGDAAVNDIVRGHE